ncbi:hypothetical protein C1H46_043636 [Malus baccata]|uniref:Uncharacterized protein n=1 Tax=Malus baccata TaxID=106549 RepID=A0A540K9C0_MALBA|nr:hypothetical protein C1H46_043636 [Malus baccata]
MLLRLLLGEKGRAQLGTRLQVFSGFNFQPPPLALAKGARERELDLMSTFSVRSLASSENMMAAVMWSLLQEIRIFYCLLSAAFRPKFM